MDLLLPVHYIATLIMTGAIWLAQLSQYPLLAYVGKKNFIRYEHEHIRRISDVAWFFIYLELATGVILVFTPTPGITLTEKVLGLALIIIIWLATMFIQYPIHKKLAKGFNRKLHKKLVNTNWIRTVAWTIRAILWSLIVRRLLGLA